MKKLIILLIPALGFSQNNQGVCINCTDPTESLDVNGKIKSRDIPLVNTAEYVIVTNADGVHKKVLLSSLSPGKCPSFKYAQSSGYSLVFTSTESIPNPNNSLTIEGKNFVSAGSYINSNLYYFQYSNTTGQPININAFTVNFSGLICNY